VWGRRAGGRGAEQCVVVFTIVAVIGDQLGLNCLCSHGAVASGSSSPPVPCHTWDLLASQQPSHTCRALVRPFVAYNCKAHANSSPVFTTRHLRHLSRQSSFPSVSLSFISPYFGPHLTNSARQGVHSRGVWSFGAATRAVIGVWFVLLLLPIQGSCASPITSQCFCRKNVSIPVACVVVWLPLIRAALLQLQVGWMCHFKFSAGM
jgi:hypothetical protein